MRAVMLAHFTPELVDITDQSARHAGHAGSSGDGQTHYDMRVVSEAFTGQSRVERSRAVHAALATEFDRGLHALSLRLQTPAEATRTDAARGQSLMG